MEPPSRGKGIINSNELVSTDKDSFLGNLNISDDVKTQLEELIDFGHITLHEMEVYAFEKFQQLTKPFAIDVLCRYKEIALTGQITKETQFFANIVANYQAKLENPTAEGYYAPPADPIVDLLHKTGYKLEISTGQRRYYRNSKSVTNPKNTDGQCFIGSLNREAFEPEIVTLLDGISGLTIRELRIMMGYDGKSRGFAFVTFEESNGASRCKKHIEGKSFMGKKLHVNISKPATRLFIGSVPKDKTKEEYHQELIRNGVNTVQSVIMHDALPQNKALGHKNRGFCFVDFESHMAATEVKKNLLKRSLLLFGRWTAIVDWADPMNEPGQEKMNNVRNLYVKGWSDDRTEGEIREIFQRFGNIEKVKKINNYSFVHFESRDDALRAMELLNDTETKEGERIVVTLAKPDDPNNKIKKMKRHQLRSDSQNLNQQIMTQQLYGYGQMTQSYGQQMNPYTGMVSGMVPVMQPTSHMMTSQQNFQMFGQQTSSDSNRKRKQVGGHFYGKKKKNPNYF